MVRTLPNIYFTLKEANELIPWLNRIFDSIEPLAHKVDKLSMEVKTLQQSAYSNGVSNKENEVEKRQLEIGQTTKLIEDKIMQIQDSGIVVRNISQRLVDFPHILDAREVYLCWIRGETEIRFFHETTSGYADRKPLENFNA